MLTFRSNHFIIYVGQVTLNFYSAIYQLCLNTTERQIHTKIIRREVKIKNISLDEVLQKEKTKLEWNDWKQGFGKAPNFRGSS